MLVVMLLIAMTLGLSYAAMRSQGTALKIQQNWGRRGSARHAALTGLTMALKKMHTSDWGGVGTALVDSLGEYESFRVTYAAGDPSLFEADSEYGELPYRVTLLSTGYAVAPDAPQNIATYEVRAVVRLVPRQLGKEPSDWEAMQRYTVYQTKRDSFEFDVPFRFEGPLRVQGRLKIAMHYPDDNSAWLRYLADLNKMRLGGWADLRPIEGPVDLAYTEQDTKYLSALVNRLGVKANDAPVDEAASDWTKPVSPVSYQIYDGGPIYEAVEVAGTLENVTLVPDPLKNPLGIHYNGGNVTIRGNVTVHGSLFCYGDIHIEGTDVHFQPAEMPPLHGDEGSVRLPVVSCQKFIVKRSAVGSVTGLVAVFDEFRIDKRPDSDAFTVTGRLITRKLFVKEREPWNTQNWSALYADYRDDLDDDDTVTTPYFPVWLRDKCGLDPEPLPLTIKSDIAEVRYHWHNSQNPVYAPHSDDDWLCWEVLEWTENP